MITPHRIRCTRSRRCCSRTARRGRARHHPSPKIRSCSFTLFPSFWTLASSPQGRSPPWWYPLLRSWRRSLCCSSRRRWRTMSLNGKRVTAVWADEVSTVAKTGIVESVVACNNWVFVTGAHCQPVAWIFLDAECHTAWPIAFFLEGRLK